MAAPGIGVVEGVTTWHPPGSTTGQAEPYAVLLAVDGEKIVHEEVFQSVSGIRPHERGRVELCRSPPGPGDTARAAATAGAAAGRALATGDEASLRRLLAPDVLFYDTGQPRGRRGSEAVLAWWSRVSQVELVNEWTVSGAGWAVARWTASGLDRAGRPVTLPGASVLEVRGGEVTRMTLYYDATVLDLQR
jgi:ketosteroid isomerase-like protein